MDKKRRETLLRVHDDLMRQAHAQGNWNWSRWHFLLIINIGLAASVATVLANGSGPSYSIALVEGLLGLITSLAWYHAAQHGAFCYRMREYEAREIEHALDDPLFDKYGVFTRGGHISEAARDGRTTHFDFERGSKPKLDLPRVLSRWNLMGLSARWVTGNLPLVFAIGWLMVVVLSTLVLLGGGNTVGWQGIGVVVTFIVGVVAAIMAWSSQNIARRALTRDMKTNVRLRSLRAPGAVGPDEKHWLATHCRDEAWWWSLSNASQTGIFDLRVAADWGENGVSRLEGAPGWKFMQRPERGQLQGASYFHCSQYWGRDVVEPYESVEFAFEGAPEREGTILVRWREIWGEEDDVQWTATFRVWLDDGDYRKRERLPRKKERVPAQDPEIA